MTRNRNANSLSILIVLIALIVTFQTVNAAENDDPTEYYELAITYFDELDAINADMAEFGPTIEDFEESLALSAQFLVDLDNLDVPNCADEDSMLLNDAVLGLMASLGYTLYIDSSVVGTPLNDTDLDTFFDITNRPNETWFAYEISC